MYTELHGVERLIQDLRNEELFVDSVFADDVIRIDTPKFVLLIYLPQSIRLENEMQEKAIHLDIDVLNTSYQKVLQRIKGLSGKGRRIYARETVVARVDKRVALEFLEEHHLHVPLSGKYRYGLFCKGELVSVAIFSGGRIMREISEAYRSFELLRFCHKADYLVVGGISKLIYAFIKDFNPSDIMTYADRDWSQESSLESIGFKEEGVIAAQTFFVKDGVRIGAHEDEENYDYSIKNRGSIKLKLYL